MKHALKGTWNDLEGEKSDADSSDEKMINLCLMARDDEINSNYNSFSDDDIFNDDNVHDENDNDELFEMFKQLYNKFEDLSKKHATLKKENSIISSKCEILQKENLYFKNEVSILKKEKKRKFQTYLC